MMYQLQLAWKNLSRYRRRTLITAIAIAFGLGIFIIMDSMLVGLSTESERNLLHYETGAARIMTDEYWEKEENMSLDKYIEVGNQAEKLVKEEGYLSTRRFEFSGDMIFYQDPFPEDGNLQVIVTAIDPESDDNVFRFRESISKGRYLEPGEEGMLMGAWMAEDIGADIGHYVTIVTRTLDGYYQTMELEIVGLVECPNNLVNRDALFMPIDTASLYLDMEGKYTQLCVNLPLGKEPENAAELQTKLEGTEFVVKDWCILAADFIALAEAKKTSSSTVLFFVFLIAAVGISNTMMMTIFERMREIGMMRAMGMTQKHIRNMFLFEAGGIGLLGSLGGLVLGVVANFFLVNKGLDFSFMIRDMDIGYRFTGVMYGIWNIPTLFIAFFSGIFIAVLVAVLTLGKALKRDIPSCLRST